MNLHRLRNILLVAILAIAGPVVAHAQLYLDCFTFWCTAYASYSGGSTGTINGYVEYYDDSEDVYVGVDVYLAGDYYGSNEGYDDVTVDITNVAPTHNGSWDAVGEPWFDSGDGEESDGEVTYYFTVVKIPSGEVNSAVAGGVPAGYVGSRFDVSLTPAGYPFDGYTISEAFNSSATDTCASTYHVGSPVGNPSPSSVTVAGGYGDTVAMPSAWVTDYQAVLPAGQSCRWYTTQSVSYNGVQYIQNTVQVLITSTTSCASRAGTNGAGC